MAQATKSIANFNNVTFQGRVANIDLVDGKYGEFVAITVISNLSTDDEGVSITFNNNNGLLTLHKKGYLNVGRQLTVVGRIASISEVYTDKDGVTNLRKRPLITLEGASVPTGGLGANPDKQDRPVNKVVRVKTQQPAVDNTPSIDNDVADDLTLGQTSTAQEADVEAGIY